METLPPLTSTTIRALWAQWRCSTSALSPVGIYGWPSPLLVATPSVPAFAALSQAMAAHKYAFTEGAGGTYNCRKLTGSDVIWSLHAYGLAIDINPSRNKYGAPLTTDIPPAMVDDIEALRTKTTGRRVFQWGGRWSKPDAMHFQISASPAELAEGIEGSPMDGHGTYKELQQTHSGFPEWAEHAWEQYRAAGGTSVPESGSWPAWRHDIAWFWLAFVRPLEIDLGLLRARVAVLEETEPAGGLTLAQVRADITTRLK